MLRYADGQEVALGDEVDFDGEPGHVIAIHEHESDFQALGMSEPVVGFKTPTYPEIYHAPADPGWDGIVLIRRLGLRHSQ